MRDLHMLDVYRIMNPPQGWAGDGTCGAFSIPSPIDKATMHIIASSKMGWDHVSVSRSNRCPNWIEMDHIARLFFRSDETVMQLHVPCADHINCHPHTLHLWRPHETEIPRPPKEMV